MTTTLFVVALIITAPLLYLAAFDGRYAVKRSLKIAASRKTVFDKIRDLGAGLIGAPG